MLLFRYQNSIFVKPEMKVKHRCTSLQLKQNQNNTIYVRLSQKIFELILAFTEPGTSITVKTKNNKINNNFFFELESIQVDCTNRVTQLIE